MSDTLRAVYVLGAFVNLGIALITFAIRVNSWINGATLLSWTQGAVALLHSVVALLFVVLYELRGRRAGIPSPATKPRSVGDDRST